MATLREIKRRLIGVRNTQKITKAMKIVAATKLKRLEKEAIGSRPFFEHIENMLRDLLATGMGVDHPYLEPRKAGKLLIVIFTSDRGLCGAFNSLLSRKVYEFAQSERALAKEVSFFLIGLKGVRFFSAKKENMFKTIPGYERRPKKEFTRELAQELVRIFLDRTVDEIVIAYNGFQSRSSYVQRIQPFLPLAFQELKKKEGEGLTAKGFFAFEPSREDVFKFLFPLYLEAKIYRALVETQTAQEAARMLAMDYATENANEITQELTLLYNRVRQAGITKEISEIVGGAEALK